METIKQRITVETVGCTLGVKGELVLEVPQTMNGHDLEIWKIRNRKSVIDTLNSL